MANAEKRGKAWRVRYQRPDGTRASEGGFETKQAALNWGNDQEAQIRRDRWHDPARGPRYWPTGSSSGGPVRTSSPQLSSSTGI